MNSLLYALFEALRCHRWLRLLACAFIFSSLGNGLTQVVVFGLLLQWSAPSALLTLAFLFATVPGYIGSLIGEKLCQRFSPLYLLMLTEWLGLLALLFPLSGAHYHSIPALLAVQSTEALLSGMSWPALTLLFKRGLHEAELPAATLSGKCDFCLPGFVRNRAGCSVVPAHPGLRLTGHRRRQFYGIAGHAVSRRTPVCSASSTVACRGPSTCGIALANSDPSTKTQFADFACPCCRRLACNGVAASTGAADQPRECRWACAALAFCQKSGTALWPLAAQKESLTRFAARSPLLLSCLALFLAAYGLLPFLSAWVVLALGMIFIAHLASNIVFAAGTFGVLSNFQAIQISAASGKAWRWQTLSASLFTGLAAMTATILGAAQTLYAVSAIALLLVALVLAHYRE